MLVGFWRALSFYKNLALHFSSNTVIISESKFNFVLTCSTKNKLLQCFIFYFAFCVEKTMTLKNFVFRKNWVRREIVSMKIKFSGIFDLSWTHILAPKCTNMECLKHFNFSQLERQKLFYYQLCDFKTS